MIPDVDDSKSIDAGPLSILKFCTNHNNHGPKQRPRIPAEQQNLGVLVPVLADSSRFSRHFAAAAPRVFSPYGLGEVCREVKWGDSHADCRNSGPAGDRAVEGVRVRR